jgi:uncharacterized protein YciW
MSTTTVFGQVGTDQASTHNKRNAVIVFTVIALFALSFFLGRATATSHVSSSAQLVTHTQLSPADRAIVANDVAPLTNTVARQLSPADRAIVAGDVSSATGTVTTEKMSAANRAEIANDVAPLSNSGNTTQLSPADRAIVANDVAPVAPLSQANTTSCIAGRPC